jgi:uncharacterized SAM-binding protein YcdF (DUF218 family)
MNAKQLRTLTAGLAVMILLLFTGAGIRANQGDMKAGKKATIALLQPARVGGVTLPAGQYVFQHVVSAGQHFATFQGPKGRVATTQKVQCTNESLKQKVSQTSVTVEDIGGVKTVTRIEIAGEDVAHVFSN